jgi:hypothetical protein
VASADAPDLTDFERDAPGMLEEIGRARKRISAFPGALNGDIQRFRDRVDKIIRESEVDNWRQVRIFRRDVDAVAADLTKAAKDKRLGVRHLAVFDASLRKLRKRDFYGARKVWHKLDKVVAQIEEVRGLQDSYRERYRDLEARVRELRIRIEQLAKVPMPEASPSEANAFVDGLDEFNLASEHAYIDFLARARSDVSVPLLYDTTQGRGVGIPGPPMGSDPEPLLRLLAGSGPGRDDVRARSFYGLLELPGYSDAKLTHLYGDSRIVRSALEEAWPWLKAIRDDERRSLLVLWSEDAGVLRRRVPALVAFLDRVDVSGDASARGKALLDNLMSGRFEILQRAARTYATHGADAERKHAGLLEKDIEAMSKEVSRLASILKKVPDPAKVEGGALD